MNGYNRAKKPVNYDAIYITDFDADVEELSLFDDAKHDVKDKNRHKPHPGTLTKTNRPVNVATNKPTANGNGIRETDSRPKGLNGIEKATLDCPPNSARSSLSKQSDAITTQRTEQSTPITQSVTASRVNANTPLNQRNPVSSIQITKRYTSTPQNKNVKGVGHEANDMYIDDIEDF